MPACACKSEETKRFYTFDGVYYHGTKFAQRVGTRLERGITSNNSHRKIRINVTTKKRRR